MPSLCFRFLWLICAFAGTTNIVVAQRAASFEQARRRMVQEEILGAGIQDRRVVQAMLETPRHEFVAAKYRQQAYFDMSLPIGAQQTISSPFIVAYMTESLDPQPGDRVLEIGTGSGYQAAVLSPLVQEVYTIEIVEMLGRRAQRTLKRLKYDNVSVKVGDGYQGWPEHAPFDKIIVTCSPESVPAALIDQLKEGGRMVVPVGERYQQILYLFTKEGGKLRKEALRPTLFVPMTGAAEAARAVHPDPLRPAAVNGNFEEPPGEDGFVPGWYYQRQVRLVDAQDAPDGKRYVEFENRDSGRGSRLLQGFAIDGRRVTRLRLSTWIQCQDVRPSPNDELPSVVISFYDKNRRDLGIYWLGPWRGSFGWQFQEKTIRVPISAQEGILRIGLFGATGKAAFDDVQLTAPTSRGADDTPDR